MAYALSMGTLKPTYTNQNNQKTIKHTPRQSMWPYDTAAAPAAAAAAGTTTTRPYYTTFGFCLTGIFFQRGPSKLSKMLSFVDW